MEIDKSKDPLFWEKTKLNEVTGCIEWTGPVVGGYGSYKSRIYAHRYSFILNLGIIPEGLFICHKCDNKKCVNPDHLFLGTCADNMRDLMLKGKALKGEENGNSILMEWEVKVLRALDGLVKQKSLAHFFGINKATIYKLNHRISWNYIPPLTKEETEKLRKEWLPKFI